MQSSGNGDGPSHWSGRVNQVLLEIINHDLAKAYFNTPPPGCNAGPGAAPICFALILQRIMDRAYGSPAEVHADIQRVWAQCRATFAPGSEPVRAADRLAPMVELLWRHMGLATSRQLGSEASLPPPHSQSPQQQAHMQAQMQQQQQQQPGSRPLSSQSFGQDPAGLGQLERADQQAALLAQQQQQLLMGQRRRAAAAAAAAGMARQHSLLGFGSEGGPQLEHPGFGSGTFSGGGAQQSLAGARSLSLGLGAPGGTHSMDPLHRGGSGAFGQESSLLLAQQAQQAQQADLAAAQRAAAQDRAWREQRVQSLLRLRQEIMAGAQPDPGVAHAAPDAQHAHTLSLAPLGARGGSDGSLQRQISLAEQQQQMLNAMASGQAPPRQQGDPAAGAMRPPSRQHSLAAMLSAEASLPPYLQQDQQQRGDAAAGQEHEAAIRQKQQLAQLKRNMLAALQQRQALHSQQQQLLQQQQAAQQQLQQQQFGGGPGPQHQLQAAQFAGSGLGQQQLAALQRGYSLDQLQLSQGAAQTPLHDGGSLLSPSGSQMVSPAASLGVSGRRQARQRQASLHKEAASPAGPPGDDASLRLGHPLRRCLAVMERLLQHEDAEPFAEPVDAEGLGLVDYRQIIRRPMDLGTIRGRLAPGLSEGWGTIQYKSTDEVLSDVQLVWANCRRYNAAGSPIIAMCDRLETAFCRLWEAAGLGSAAAAAARPHVLSPAAPTHGRNEARGKPHQRQTHGKSGAKPSPRSTAAKLSTAQEPRPAGKPGGGRKNSHGGTGSAGGAPAKRQRAEAGAPAPISPPAPAVPAALPDLPEDFSLAPAQLADAEVAEEALELERLLGTGGTSPTAAAAAAAATGGSSSPVLWEAALPGGLGPDAVAEAVAVPEALAGLGPGAAPSLQANGEAAVSERDRFGADWQAVGTSALASPMASRQAASGVLLHPDREPLAAHGSLPPPLPRHHSLEPPQQRADAPLHAPPVGTAGAAREGMQREESVLAAWQRVQAQRQAALQAMAAAEAAAHEVVKARQELAAVRAAEAAASAGAPVSSQSQAAWEQQQLRRQEESPATASGLTGEQPGRLPSTGYSRSAVMNGLRAAAAAGCSSSELASMATAARQARYAALLQLGSQLFGSSGCGPASSAGDGEGGSSGSTQVLPGSGTGSPGQASGLSPAGRRAGSGSTRGVSPASAAMEVDVKAEPAVVAPPPVVAA